MTKQLLTFEKYKNIEDPYNSAYANIAEALEESEAPYICPIYDDDPDEDIWVCVSMSDDTITLMTVDASGTTKLPCFAFIHNFGMCALESANVKQGGGIDNDLDYCTVTYKIRPSGLGGVEKQVEAQFNKIVKELNITK